VRSKLAIDHALPLELVQVSAAPGRVTADPALDAVLAVVIAVPPVVYPPPLVISVPAAEAVLTVELRRTFIAVAESAVNVPGIPDAPVGVVALRIFDTMP
jgi:hypothetical protein